MAIGILADETIYKAPLINDYLSVQYFLAATFAGGLAHKRAKPPP
jgi:hypothetical protein